MRLRAMAKINLGLDVLRKREDGYHEVRMIMQTIQMYDLLDIRKKSEPGIELSTNLPYVPSDERNLVYKAAKLLMDEFDVKEGLSMKLTKSIPVAAGMAGGAAGGQAAVQQQTPKKPVVKRVYDAVPEDVKAIAAGWKDIIATIDDPVNQTFLQAAHVTLAEDGISLEIMVEC